MAKKARKKATKKKVAKKATKKKATKKTTAKKKVAKKATKKKVAKKKGPAKKAKATPKTSSEKKVKTLTKPKVPSLEEIAQETEIVIPPTNPFSTTSIEETQDSDYADDELHEDGELGLEDDGYESPADMEADDYEDLDDDDDDDDFDGGSGSYF